MEHGVPPASQSPNEPPHGDLTRNLGMWVVLVAQEADMYEFGFAEFGGSGSGS